MLNKKFKIWAKVSGKRLAFAVEDLIGEAQTCAIPIVSIHDNLHHVKG